MAWSHKFFCDRKCKKVLNIWFKKRWDWHTKAMVFLENCNNGKKQIILSSNKSLMYWCLMWMHFQAAFYSFLCVFNIIFLLRYPDDTSNDPFELFICPYDRNHKIQAKKWQSHLNNDKKVGEFFINISCLYIYWPNKPLTL